MSDSRQADPQAMRASATSRQIYHKILSREAMAIMQMLDEPFCQPDKGVPQ